MNDIWKNKYKILEGLKNKLFKKQDVEDVAEFRMNICRGCEHLDTEGSNCTVPGTQPCCGKCGCSLSLKTRSLSLSCPLDNPKWDAITDIETANKVKQLINEQLNKKE